ncbi:MAG: hypothetical protein J6J27_03150 [Alphaproteobacteria bacterium]|nr:hypothetical protein [Alphaproteobacteria bacterium]
MKKLLPLFLVLLCFSENAISATRKSSTRRISSASKTVTYTTPTQDQCNIDIDYCFSRYCFDKKTLNEGVYSKCGAEPASTILVNVEDCLATRAVIKQLDLQNGCKTYSYNRIVSLLNSKGTIETGLKKNSTECAKATRALQAAKKCYTAMISSDGSSSVELYNELDSLCGFEASGDSYMLNRFYQAGDYGDSNVGALEDLRLTGQNTQKRENWRQVVDATLVGYTEMAELACGAEDYKLTKVNEYDLDSHSNSQMIALEAEAKAIGEQSADKVVNQWFRESDCVNSPLPVGGLYWSYKKGGNPDCRIVCKEGYFVGRNSSTCVKAQDDKQETFIGLNIGNNWIGEKKVQQKKDETPTDSKSTSDLKTEPEPAPKVENTECSKAKTTYTMWSPSKGIDGVCEVFFPNCKTRYYYRNTDSEEFFCTGPSRGVYDKWYKMKLNNDNGTDLNSIFKTKYSRFGNDYKEELSALIKETCLDRCKGEAPKGDKLEAKCSDVPTGETGNISGWKSFVEKYVSTGNCRCGYESVKDTLGKWNDQTRWTLDGALSANMKDYRNCLCQSDSTPSNDKCANKEATDSVKRWDWVEARNACAPAECQSGYKLCDGGRDCCLDSKTSQSSEQKTEYSSDLCSQVPSTNGGETSRNGWKEFIQNHKSDEIYSKCLKNKVEKTLSDYESGACRGNNCIGMSNAVLQKSMVAAKDCICAGEVSAKICEDKYNARNGYKEKILGKGCLQFVANTPGGRQCVRSFWTDDSEDKSLETVLNRKRAANCGNLTFNQNANYGAVNAVKSNN